jgi:predicted DNA-binding ArsR family transcriptional regulator
VLRRVVLDEVRRTGQDRVPDYYVVTPSEIEQLIPDGARSLKGIKPGDLVDNKWRYVGKAFHGEQFLIFERVHRE